MEHKKIAFIFIVSLVIVLGLGFTMLLIFHNSQKVFKPKTSVLERIETPEIYTTMTTEDAWETGQWQSFSFTYPNKFVLTDGSFKEKYFYLDYDPLHTSRSNIRIFGISENWDKKSIEEVVSSRMVSDERGFTEYFLEEQDYLTPDIHYKQFTYTLGSTKYRSYRMIKRFGEDFRILTVNSDIYNWDHNKKIFDRIIENIEY